MHFYICKSKYIYIRIELQEVCVTYACVVTAFKQNICKQKH